MIFSQNIIHDISLERNIRIVLDIHNPEYIDKEDYIQFRCNVCGDSQKSKSKKRAYILKREKPWKFYCHNCQLNTTAEKWLKEYYPMYFRNFIKEILINDKKQEDKPNTNLNRPKKQIIEITDEEKKNTKFFVNIEKMLDGRFENAVDICIKRNISKDIYRKWFIATDGMYKNRMIIPYYDNKGKIYYYQGRALYSWMIPKYLSRKDPNGKMNHIYNYYNIDNDKPVICFEGSIDSLFCENAVGLTGLNIQDVWLKNIKHKYFILDKDKAGIKKSLQLLIAGEYVFLWSKFIKDLALPKREKWDMNDVVVYINKKSKFSFDDLKSYFTNTIYDKALLWM